MENGLGMLNVLESRTLADMIYDAVRSAILSGDLPPGSRLRETELAERMHVSRTPVREALCRLESEAMIEYIPRRGMVVRSVSDQEVRELFLLRLALEPVAVQQAAGHLGPAEMGALRVFFKTLGEAARTGCEEDFYRAFGQVLDLLLAAGNLPLMTGMINTCRERLLRCRRMGADEGAAERLRQQEERCAALLKSLRCGDGTAAGEWHRTFLEAEQELYLMGGGLAADALQAVAAPVE